MSDVGSVHGRDRDLEHERLRTDLAGYVLGGLTVEEQRAVEAHLTGCAECRRELAGLDPLPVLLDLAASEPGVGDRPAGEPVAAGVAPVGGDAVTPGVGDSARPVGFGGSGAPRGGGEARAPGRRLQRPRRRATVAVAAAAAALAVAAAVLVGVIIARPSEPAFSTPIALQPVEGASASGTAALRTTDTGTVVRLDLDGLAAGEGTWFECIWTSGQGPRSAGTFRAGSDGSVRVDLTTAAARYGGWELQVVEHRLGAAEGTPVLTATA